VFTMDQSNFQYRLRSQNNNEKLKVEYSTDQEVHVSNIIEPEVGIFYSVLNIAKFDSYDELVLSEPSWSLADAIVLASTSDNLRLL